MAKQRLLGARGFMVSLTISISGQRSAGPVGGELSLPLPRGEEIERLNATLEDIKRRDVGEAERKRLEQEALERAVAEVQKILKEGTDVLTFSIKERATVNKFDADGKLIETWRGKFE